MLKIESPTLVLNEDICRKNIKKMADKAADNNLIFRPHFKTAQSIKIGEWFKEAGVEKITVSSLQMAEYFANAGWMDITVAFPINILEIQRINKLNHCCSDLQLLIDEGTPIKFLDQNLYKPLNVCIKIDSGAGRTGFCTKDENGITKALCEIQNSKNLNFIGFLTHAGQSYHCRSTSEIIEVHNVTTTMMIALKNKYLSIYPHLMLSVGDTPTCVIAENWEGIDEIRPGNFTFFDLMQWQIGSCSLDDIAVEMLCPVVAKHQSRKELIIYGGAVHFSKDFIVIGETKNFGLVYKFGAYKKISETNYVSALSQEHGIVRCTDSFFQNIEVGDILCVLPVHSCLTADSIGFYKDKNAKYYDHLKSAQ